LKQIDCCLDGDIPEVTLQADPKRLRRVLANLASNACDAMDSAGRLLVRVEKVEQELITTLQDTGPGLADAILERLFQPFATHGKAQGTGLGLSICQQIIEEHGGQIRAQNAPEGGAMFVFTLPLKT